MDVSKNQHCNDKKMVVKIGSGGGVGTVILFGGALATAALASAFVVGLKKRRNSVVNRPAKKSEANDQEVNGEFVFVDDVSSAALSKEIVSDSALLGDDQSLELDKKTDIDNVEVCCDHEESGLAAVDKTLEGIDKDEMEAKNSERKTDVESELNGELTEEGVEKTKLDLVANNETDQDEGETTEVDDGDVERVNVDLMEVKGYPSKEVTCDEIEPSVIGSPVIEHRNADSDMKDGVLPTADSDMKDGVLPTDMVDASVRVISENEEITKNDDVTEGVTGVIEEHDQEGIREDEVKHVVEEELLAEEQKEIDQYDECEKTEQVNEEVDEEKSNIENEPENQELGDCERNVEKLPILEKEMISVEGEANEVPENKIPETIGKEVEDSSKSIGIDAEKNTANEADLSATTDTDTEKRPIDLIMETNEIVKGETEIVVDYDEMDLSDEAEESSVGTGESSTDSNSEAVWPAEESLETQQVNLVNHEVGGKTLEDKKPEPENDFHDRAQESQRATDNIINNYSISKNAIKKYFTEFSMVKDQPENATKKAMFIVILSLFSSYSCSWVFGCSFVKLSLIMFFSVILSKIHGYGNAGIPSIQKQQ